MDFVLADGSVAIEVKISDSVRKSDLKGLIAFIDDYQPQQAYVISQDPRPQLIELGPGKTIHILPWREFLDRLWAGEIV